METKTTKKAVAPKKKATKKTKPEVLAPESKPFNSYQSLSFFEKVKKFLGL
jgi:hypothetical protein